MSSIRPQNNNNHCYNFFMIFGNSANVSELLHLNLSSEWQCWRSKTQSLLRIPWISRESLFPKIFTWCIRWSYHLKHPYPKHMQTCHWKQCMNNTKTYFLSAHDICSGNNSIWSFRRGAMKMPYHFRVRPYWSSVDGEAVIQVSEQAYQSQCLGCKLQSLHKIFNYFCLKHYEWAHQILSKLNPF